MDMNIAIVENNQSDFENLHSLLKDCPNISEGYLIQHFKSGEEFLEQDTGPFQLVFMDIYMDGMDGVETAQKFHDQNDSALIVFLTSSKEDVYRAVRTHLCFDYILKEELNADRIRKLIYEAEKELHLKNTSVEFYSGKQKIVLTLNTIQYICSQDKYTEVTFSNNKKELYRVTFKCLSEILLKSPVFLLCNRGICLNMDYIDSVRQNEFIMKDGSQQSIRRSNHREILERFHNYQYSKL